MSLLAKPSSLPTSWVVSRPLEPYSLAKPASVNLFTPPTKPPHQKILPSRSYLNVTYSVFPNASRPS